MVVEKKKHDQNSEACSYEGTLYIEVLSTIGNSNSQNSKLVKKISFVIFVVCSCCCCYFYSFFKNLYNMNDFGIDCLSNISACAFSH